MYSTSIDNQLKLIRYERKTKLNQVFVSSAEPGWVPVANLMSMKRLYCIHLQILLLGKLFVWIFVGKKKLYGLCSNASSEL